MGVYSCEMPTEVLRSKIVISDGCTWVSAKTAPYCFYGGDMTYNFKPERVRCQHCGKLVALNRKGKPQAHNFGSTGNRCHPPSKNKNKKENYDDQRSFR
jgi:hypothetical protein